MMLVHIPRLSAHSRTKSTPRYNSSTLCRPSAANDLGQLKFAACLLAPRPLLEMVLSEDRLVMGAEEREMGFSYATAFPNHLTSFIYSWSLSLSINLYRVSLMFQAWCSVLGAPQ